MKRYLITKENQGEIGYMDSSQVHNVGDVNSFSGIGVTKGHPSEDEEGESGVEVEKGEEERIPQRLGDLSSEALDYIQILKSEWAIVEKAFDEAFWSSLELAALGPGTVVCDYMSYVFMFLSIATSNMVATSIAREENHKISILLFVGFTCGVGMLPLTKSHGCTNINSPFYRPKNLSIVPAANTYVQIQGLAWPSILVGWVAQSASLGMGIIRGIGDIVLCCFLGYGIVGAAWATMVSQIIAACMMIESLNKKGFNAYSIPVPSPKELLKIFELAASVFITMISKHGALSFLDSHSCRRFSFSFYFRYARGEPAEAIWKLKRIDYDWLELFGITNRLAVGSLWLPKLLICLVDIQRWYSILSSLVGSLALYEVLIRRFPKVKRTSEQLKEDGLAPLSPATNSSWLFENSIKLPDMENATFYRQFIMSDLGKILRIAWAQEEGCFDRFWQIFDGEEGCCGENSSLNPRRPLKINVRDAANNFDLNVADPRPECRKFPWNTLEMTLKVPRSGLLRPTMM
ncbi:hypothetical protein IFM89_008401 [Coptis chinensis]|uniref:Multidrug and toxic compound extrusion protein n=1 Tax=Coptis chinensis TaxID=261450 RepID=A0A835HDP2_9MAGN|nr:hypothetical protein IFM89_008401 [Coptis chinensis]